MHPSVLIPGVTKQTEPKTPPAPNPRGMTTFTGEVTVDPMHTHTPATDVEADFNAAMAVVTFNPCARTYWHWHEKGQLLTVTKGSGWVCDKGGEPRRIQAGDMIWCPPGITHWHGADSQSQLVHVAFGMGKVAWYEEVSDAEYPDKRSTS